jgi:nitroreductase
VDLLEALYTTRAMRRVKPDPIPEDVQARILDAAIRAPSGGNAQNWRFVLVDDPAVKTTLGPIYRDSFAQLLATFYNEPLAQARATADRPESATLLRVMKSAQYLADHFEEYPLLLFAFSTDASGQSAYPAVWSAMLAARAEGVGSALTSVMNVFRREDVLRVLEVPDGWFNTGCVTMGYPTGRWGRAERQPVHEVSYRNHWGSPLGFEVPAPLWP